MNKEDLKKIKILDQRKSADLIFQSRELAQMLLNINLSFFFTRRY